MHRHQIAIRIGFASCTCSQTDTKCQRLLDNQHQHGRQNRGTITTLRVKHRHLLYFERTRGYHILASCIVASQSHLHSRPHLGAHSHRRLVNGLIRQHQRHIAIHANGSLLHTIKLGSKIFGNIIDALGHLSTYQTLSLIQIYSMTNHLHIGRSIAHTDKLARLM